MSYKSFRHGISWLLVGIVLGGALVIGIDHFVTLPHERAAQQVKNNQQSNQQRAENRLQKNKERQKKPVADPYAKNVASQLTPVQTQLIKKLLTTNKVIGTLLVVKNNKVIWQQGFGYADAAAQRGNNAASLYQIGSIQKSLTATLFVKDLIDTGKVKYNDPVAKYYPTIPHGHQITIRDMLDMVSGIYHTDLADKVMTDQEIVNWSAKHLTVKPENIGLFSYQPINFTLLTGILEKETGQNYQDLLDQQLLTPLNLVHTGFVQAMGDEKHRTYSYKDGTTYQRYPDESQVEISRELGTGNLYASAGDLFRMEQGIIQGKIISKKRLAELRNTTNGSYRGGAYCFKTYVNGHGVEAGYDAGYALAKDGRSGVVLLANTYPKQTTSKLATQIAQMVLHI
ncbi:penicillin-binding protein precursor (Beta-lactamase class C) [Lactobacillus selangorensis]|uniref:Penicillin-binding protein (Beta-lactamase class C) n=1 Tax=Lactobacillus selangorensis TaxID=81857 RepID=A0A0R2FRA7_9LACO|nr:serine hydrolase domain-containing protein [Lactobacillus selangorensis]KRN27556.1 penicillin-binding protein precursor (Beta-lactamase class C) [Lactobacillus selangorensis]KRN30171.1 penicillin-binding protein precursor (Beta-lactamase class C) [Lactobacillus selangorensis]